MPLETSDITALADAIKNLQQPAQTPVNATAVKLPWVLLGIRTAPKEDLGASTAELVYGGPLTVPGDFVPDGTPKPVSHHLEQQRRRVGDLRPVPTTAHGERHIRTHLPDTLQKAKFVFVH